MSVLKSIFDDGRATLRSWRVYTDQTGETPWLWIAVHVLNWITIIAAIALPIPISRKYHLSKEQALGVLTALAVPYGILWLWIKSRVRLSHLKKQRNFAKIKKRR